MPGAEATPLAPSPAHATRPVPPKAPVLDWSSFRGRRAPGLPSVDDLAQATATTSGRAAIYHAVLQLALPPASLVLVPTYHCPTMIAPVVCAGMTPGYFAIGPDGLPDLASIDATSAGRARAMIVAHYFGLPHSLQAVRAWCDAHDVVLIEDCAHAYFGHAGERQVGGWGDFATASVSKFFPVPEAGVLASTWRPVTAPRLAAPRLGAQAKGVLDVLEVATRHQRLAGPRRPLAALFALKNVRSGRAPATAVADDVPALPQDAEDEAMRRCDMGRITQAPLWVSSALKRFLPRARIVARRRRHFALYADLFTGVHGARALMPMPEGAVPYVFPLFVDDAERVYAGLRQQRLPVFRWDRVWPGTPALPGDLGPLWSRHVLQLLCHQDLSAADVAHTARATLRLLAAAP